MNTDACNYFADATFDDEVYVEEMGFVMAEAV
jgi:hypothetical protein